MNRIVACIGVVACACITSIARAEEPFTQETAQVAVQLAFGIDTDDDDNAYGFNDLNAYGFGLGGRAGYTLRPGIYVGGLFDFFFGESDEQSVLGQEVAKESVNAWLLQGEVGYDIGLSDNIVVRPKAGIGITHVADEGCVTPPLLAETCDDTDDTDFSFAPGVELPISFGGIFVAPELRFNISDRSAFIFSGDLGATF